jgi:NCAIR mutase (PurE)-related protein
MTEEEIRQILHEYRAGVLSDDGVLDRLRNLPFENLGFANVDHHRSLRQGFPEAVFGAGKTPEQVARIVESLAKNQHNILVTRATAEQFARVRDIIPSAEFHSVARTIVVRKDETIRGKVRCSSFRRALRTFRSLRKL